MSFKPNFIVPKFSELKYKQKINDMNYLTINNISRYLRKENF